MPNCTSLLNPEVSPNEMQRLKTYPLGIDLQDGRFAVFKLKQFPKQYPTLIV